MSSVPIDEYRRDVPLDDQVPEEKRSIALPDGSRVPVLNGAYGAPDMVGSWPDGRPWSPIVRIDTDSFGKQWYVHADESRSQTVILQFRRSGESSFQPMTLVYTPIDGDIRLQSEVAAPDRDAPGSGRETGTTTGASRER
ncbi:MAG: hypothetical protein IPM29_02080 [Planctomycetes bacterium]|nr:hypothetical protein [Planctomycetota bacterium]